jgi:hypothetical protein
VLIAASGSPSISSKSLVDIMPTVRSVRRLYCSGQRGEQGSAADGDRASSRSRHPKLSPSAEPGTRWPGKWLRATGGADGVSTELVEDDPVEHAADDGRAIRDHDLPAGDHGMDPPVVIERHQVGVPAGSDATLRSQARRLGDV